MLHTAVPHSAPLQAPRPLNCMLAGYFSRVMGSLLLRRTQDIMQYLQKHQELLLQVAALCMCHLATSLLRASVLAADALCFGSSQVPTLLSYLTSPLLCGNVGFTAGGARGHHLNR